MPHENIIPAFNQLVQEEKGLNPQQLVEFQRFLNYFERFWIRNITPAGFSVFNLDRTTNNGAEIFHARIKKKIRNHHTGIWFFLDHLNEIAGNFHNDFKRLRDGEGISRPRKKKNVRNQNKREAAFKSLERCTITPMYFLRVVSHTIENIPLVQDNHVDVPEINDDGPLDPVPVPQPEQNLPVQGPQGEEGQLENQGPICVVCLGVREKTFGCWPCRHARFCQGCAQTLQARDEQQCPICRTPVTQWAEFFI